MKTSIIDNQYCDFEYYDQSHPSIISMSVPKEIGEKMNNFLWF